MLKSSSFCPKFQTRSEEELRKQSYAMHYEPDLRKVMEARSPEDLFFALSSIVGHYNYAFSSRFGGPMLNVFGTYKTTKRCGADDTAACFREACSRCRVRGAMSDWFHAWCGNDAATERMESHVNAVFGDVYPRVSPTHPQRASMQKAAHDKLATVLQGPGGSFEGSTTKYRLCGSEVIVTDKFPIPPAARVDFFARIEKEAAIHAVDPTNESLLPLFQRMCSFAQLYCFSMTRDYYGNAPVKLIPGDWDTKVFDSPVCPEGKYRDCHKCRVCQLFVDIAKLMIPDTLHDLKLPALIVEIKAHFHPLNCTSTSSGARSLELVDQLVAASNAEEQKRRLLLHQDHAITSKSKRLAGQKRKDNDTDKDHKVAKSNGNQSSSSNGSSNGVDSAFTATPTTPTAVTPTRHSSTTASPQPIAQRKRIRRISESPEKDSDTTATAPSHPKEQEVIVARLADTDLNREFTLDEEEAAAILSQIEEHHDKLWKTTCERTLKSIASVSAKPLAQKILKAIDTVASLEKPLKLVFPESSCLVALAKMNEQSEASTQGVASGSPSEKIAPHEIPFLRLAMMQRMRTRFFQTAAFAPLTSAQESDWKHLTASVSFDALMESPDQTAAERLVDLKWVRNNLKATTSALWPRALWAIVIHQLFSHGPYTTTIAAIAEKDAVFMVYYQIGLMCSKHECFRRLDLARMGLTWSLFQQLVSGHPSLPTFFDTFVSNLTAHVAGWEKSETLSRESSIFFEGQSPI